jgi:hypothetical protein
VSRVTFAHALPCRTLVNLLQDADEASLPAILNCMHFLCDNDPAAQVRPCNDITVFLFRPHPH